MIFLRITLEKLPTKYFFILLAKRANSECISQHSIIYPYGQGNYSLICEKKKTLKNFCFPNIL